MNKVLAIDTLGMDTQSSSFEVTTTAAHRHLSQTAIGLWTPCACFTGHSGPFTQKHSSSDALKKKDPAAKQDRRKKIKRDRPRPHILSHKKNSLCSRLILKSALCGWPVWSVM